MKNIALVGTGKWGKNYISTISQIPGVNLKYICAKSETSLKSFKGDFIKYTDYSRLLELKDIDGVIIATPNSSHFQIVSDFLRNGFDVLVEKPLVEDYIQALKLKEIQIKSGAYLQIGHIYLFDPAFIEAKQQIKKIGRVRVLSFEGTGNWPIRKDSSVFWDIGTHAVSLALDVYPKNPKAVSAWAVNSVYSNSNNYDYGIIKIIFEDNIEAFLKISWIYPIKRRELLIVGENDSVIYDAQSENKLIYFKNSVGEKGNFHPKENLMNVKLLKYDTKSPLENEIESFLKNIDHPKNRRSDLDFGIKVTRILDLANKSAKNNGKQLNFK